MSPTSSAAPPEARDWPVAGTGLAGALIVALALPASTRMEATGVPRWLVVAAVILAVLTVTAAVGAVVLRGAGRLPKLLAVAAGLLLIAATAFTGSAAAAAALADGSPPAAAVREGLTVVLSGVGEDARLTLRAEMPDVAAGALVRAEVVAVQDADVRMVVAQQLTVARTTGTVSVDLTATRVGGFDMLQVLVESPERRCTADVRPLVTESPVVSCKAR
jgi:hypothetical protein